MKLIAELNDKLLFGEEGMSHVEPREDRGLLA